MSNFERLFLSIYGKVLILNCNGKVDTRKHSRNHKVLTENNRFFHIKVAFLNLSHDQFSNEDTFLKV